MWLIRVFFSNSSLHFPIIFSYGFEQWRLLHCFVYMCECVLFLYCGVVCWCVAIAKRRSFARIWILWMPATIFTTLQMKKIQPNGKGFLLLPWKGFVYQCMLLPPLTSLTFSLQIQLRAPLQTEIFKGWQHCHSNVIENLIGYVYVSGAGTSAPFFRGTRRCTRVCRKFMSSAAGYAMCQAQSTYSSGKFYPA